jgi:RNA polymerase sigma factor (sigma-70 family)
VTIARCRAIDAVRRSVRGRRSQDSDPDAPDEINIVGLEQASLEQHVGAATDHDPEHAFVVNEQQKILLGLVRGLPERERAIFNAVHFEGRSRADVGRDLGVTPQRVGQIYGATLRKIWEQARSDPAFPSETDRKGDT